MAKTKHNKKKNTGILFELFARHIINTSDDDKRKLGKIFRKHFSEDSELLKELYIFEDISGSTGSIEESVSKDFLNDVCIRFGSLNKKKLDEEKKMLLEDLEKVDIPNFFDTFMENYRQNATIHQYLHAKSTKERLLFENKMMTLLQNPKELKIDHVDNLTYKVCCKSFNEKYGGELLKEQKELVNHFIGAVYTDVGLKAYLNEEVQRLISGMERALEESSIKNNEYLLNKTKSILEGLTNLKNRPMNKNDLVEIMKVQRFIHELNDFNI